MSRLSIVRTVVAVAVVIAIGTIPAWALTVEQEAKLLASDGAAEDFFGGRVAIDGDTAILGAAHDDDNGSSSGSAYVFTRTAGVWTEQAKLLASDGAAEDYFGASLAIDGDTAIIGAASDDDNGPDSGSAYVFIRAAGMWTQQAKLLPSDGTIWANFGSSTAIDSDTVVIGQPGDSLGSAYVFTRTGDVWTEQAKLVPSDVTGGFGWSVSLDGDSVVVGTHVTLVDRGAYVFTRTGGLWTEQGKLTPADPWEYNAFGESVALDGDTAVVGAYNADDDIGESTGAAYVFTRTGDVWTEQATIPAPDGSQGDAFGSSPAIDGDTLAIGAARDDDNGPQSGSAYVFRLYDDDVPATSVVGLALLLLAVLGTGVYFMRRRAAG